MRLEILVAGPYNNLFNRARHYEPGEILETGTEYGLSLIASDYARQIVVEEANVEEPAPPQRTGPEIEAPAPPAPQGSRGRGTGPARRKRRG